MWIRRAFYYVQFAAILLLPLWLLIGRGLVIQGPGWEFVFLLFVCPMLALAMIVVLGLTLARKAVRRNHALSWLDVAVLALWYLSIVGAGMIAYPVMLALVVVIAVVAFWLAIWQLFIETRHRVNTALARWTAVPDGHYAAPIRHDGQRRTGDRGGRPTVIRIEPPDH